MCAMKLSSGWYWELLLGYFRDFFMFVCHSSIVFLHLLNNKWGRIIFSLKTAGGEIKCDSISCSDLPSHITVLGKVHLLNKSQNVLYGKLTRIPEVFVSCGEKISSLCWKVLIALVIRLLWRNEFVLWNCISNIGRRITVRSNC